MKINITREGRYIPKWNGNRDEPDSEQIIVEYTNLTHEQRKKYITNEKPVIHIDDFDRKSDDEIDEDVMRQHARMELKVDTDSDGMVVAMSPKIRNLEDNEGNPIDTWSKLLAVPQTKENQIGALITEITGELSSLSKEKDPKN